MDIVVEFCGRKHPGVKCTRMDSILEAYGDDGSESIVRSVSLNDNRNVWDPLGQCQSGGEGLLEGVEGFLALFGPDPRSDLAGEASEGDHDIGVERNEAMIKIGKSQK